MQKVSVIVPTYNCALYISQAIESGLKQTHKNVEIIVVDDGSTDDTCQIIRVYEQKGLIKYIYQENKGLPGARNTGILKAKGEFIVFLDADDELNKNMISKCLETVQRENTDWCIIDILRIENAKSGLKEEIRRSNIPNKEIKKKILEEDFIRSAPFFKKDTLFEASLYDENMRNREDWDINIRMIMAGKRFSYVPEALYIYKIRTNSITKSKNRKLFDYTLQLLRKHHKKIADAGDSEVAKIYATHLWRLGKTYLTDVHDLKSSVACITESMRYDFSI